MQDKYVIQSAAPKGAGMAAKIRAIRAQSAVVERRRAVDSAMHTAFVQVGGHLDRQPNRAWYAMRSKEQRWWGHLCQRIAEAIIEWEEPPSLDVMLTIPEVIESFVTDCYDQRIEIERRRRNGAA